MQTTSQGFKYVEPADAITDFPAVDQSNWKLAEARTPRRVTSAQMTALTGLVDAQEIELEVDAAAGIYWRLRYRAGSASAYKWEAVCAGIPLAHEILTTEITTSNVYVDLPTVGPLITLPRDGDYLLRMGCYVGGGATSYKYYSPSISGAAPVDGEGLSFYGAAVEAEAFRERRVNGITGSRIIKMMYKNANSSPQFAAHSRWLAALPIRVA